MKRPMKRKVRALSAERLEKRDLFSGDTPAFIGVGSLTYSFAPEGTPVGTQVNHLQSKFDGVAATDVWHEAFAKAFETWSKVSNINFGLVDDNGAPSGVYGPTRGDERFGDIRISGFDFAADTSAEAVTEDTRSVGTWAGDIIFNTAVNWTSADRIEAAALHEIGHILGLGHSTDPASPMFVHGPSGALALTAQDVSNVQAIHGPRALDSNEGSQGNDTIGRASHIKGGENDSTVLEGFKGDQVWLQFGDLDTPTDRDVYEIRTALGYTGKIAVELRSKGLSLARLSAELTDRNGNVLGQANQVDGVAVIKLDQTVSGGKYYLQVHSGTDPFWATGDYSITIADPTILAANNNTIAEFARNAHRWYYDSNRSKDGFSWHLQTVPNSEPESNDNHSDDTQSTSTTVPVVLTTDSRTVYRIVGTISDLTDIDFFRVDAPTTLNGHTEMTVSLESLGVAGLVPDIQVFDAVGTLQTTELRVRGYGQTELVLNNVQPKQRFFIKLNGDSVGDAFKTGSFAMHVTFAAPSTPPELLASGVLNQGQSTNEHEWYIARPQLFGLALEGLVNSSSASGEIWVSIFDHDRKFVTGLVAPINELRSAPGVFLDTGIYYFQIAASVNGSPTADVTFRFTAERPSQAVGPLIGNTNVQPLFLCPGSTTTYCYPNSSVPVSVPQQVGPPPTVALPSPPPILTIVTPPDQWFWSNIFLPTNPANALDTNGDGRVDPLDALVVINWVNSHGFGPVPTPPQFQGFLDADASGTVDPLDVLVIINQLNRNR